MSSAPVTAGDAMAAAREAHHKISTHEEVCAERYNGITDKMGVVGDRCSRIEGILLAVAGAIILQLLGLVVTLSLAFFR